MEAPASPVLLVLTLRGRRNSKKTRTKKRKRKRKKPRDFSVHDVPAPEIRHTCAVSKDRAGSAPAAASAYFTDFSYAQTILQLQLNRWDCRRAGCPSLTEGIGPPRVRTHLSSIYRTHSATTQCDENCCAVLCAVDFELGGTSTSFIRQRVLSRLRRIGHQVGNIAGPIESMALHQPLRVALLI